MRSARSCGARAALKRIEQLVIQRTRAAARRRGYPADLRTSPERGPSAINLMTAGGDWMTLVGIGTATPDAPARASAVLAHISGDAEPRAYSLAGRVR